MRKMRRGQGELSARNSADGTFVAAFLWLVLSACPGGDITVDAGTLGATPPSTTKRADPIYYYHNDRLGTPVRMTDENGTTVWRAEYAPFGGLEKLETDPDGDGVHVENNLRLPGQYDDALSSLLMAGGPYYNWHRQYSPDLGRYHATEPFLQVPDFVATLASYERSVPTYAYALNIPLRYLDPDGQTVQCVVDCNSRANRQWDDCLLSAHTVEFCRAERECSRPRSMA